MQQLPVDEDGIASWRVAFRLTKGDGVPPTELRPFLVGLRNAIAHASMEFGTDGASITGIRFLNRTNDKAKRILWEVAFDLDGLRGFLDHLTDEVERACRGRT